MSATVFAGWLVLLRDLSVKSALLLLAAWALTLAMRRASAAARHLAWLLTFAGLLLLPLLSVTLPARPVPVLPPPAVPVALPPPVAPAAVSSPAAPPLAVEAPTNAVPDRLPAPPPPARSLPAPSTPASPDWSSPLCCFWLLGVVLAALPFAAGWILAARRIRRCSPVTDPATLALAAEAGRRLGLRCPVSLRSGPSVPVPVTFGLVRPVILLPDGAASWPAERRRVALLHEMAHIRRGDWATQTAARLVCALFWHNPLVWPAARMLRAEAERACDDLVLSSGIPAPDYAQHLLAVAAALSGANHPLPLAVPMAGRGPLESRLRAVLIARPRRAPSRRLAVAAFALALGVLVPLAVLRPAARAARWAVRPLTSAPAVLPAPPKAVRPSPPPVKAVVAIPLALVPPPVPIQSMPKGVPPMKPPTPIKAALTALVAGLALPAAHAQPNAPVKHAPAPNASTPQSRALMIDVNTYRGAYVQGVTPTAAPPTNPPAVPAVRLNLNAPAISSTVVAEEPRLISNPSVTLDLKKTPIRQALDTLFTAAKANYTVAADVPDDKDLVTVHLTNVPFIQALDAVLAASDTPLLYTVGEGGIFAVRPRRTHISPFARSGPAFYEPDLPGAASSDKRLPNPFTVSPMSLSPGKPGGGTDSYKAAPPVNLSVPKFIGPTSSRGTSDPSVAPPITERGPANTAPGKTP